ncbi:MAG: hypothetical protein ACREJB_06970 [Planctomycetaceae bacterium]
MTKHPNKHIREAIRYAELHGWTFTKAGPRAHIYGTLYCLHGQRGGCTRRVYSTPRDADNHARQIRAIVDRCPHQGVGA